MERRSADTIAAIATAPGRGAIGIVRVSGPRSRDILHQLAGRVADPRVAGLCRFRDARDRTIDEGIALYFPGPGSYTGEDLAEFQVHGSPMVLESLLERCVELGARIALPGEFTERAFVAGKLDLAQAEAVADLIDASSREAARAAARSLTGEFSRWVNRLREDLRNVRILVEAAIDFPEEDVDVFDRYNVAGRIETLVTSLEAVIAQARQGRMLREGIHVVLAGEPNVGKSSLLNRLAAEDVAIVTDVPGTTRDCIRASLNLGGLPVHVTDTAGLREAIETVEIIGIERTRAALGRADLGLIVIDARDDPEQAVDRVTRQSPMPERCVVVRNKIDLTGELAEVSRVRDWVVLGVSAKSGLGMDDLRRVVTEAAGWQGEEGGAAVMARTRHLDALQRALVRVLQGLDEVAQGPEVVAEELRYAEQALDEIVGWRSPDELLGDIFSRFCIGK